jgi:heme iron utilization protein
MKLPADLARDLVRRSKTATLATLARRDGDPSPYPFGSLVAAAVDARGVPLLLLSSLAEHTKNLSDCPHASLLYAEHVAVDPLAGPRVTLVGNVIRIGNDQRDSARAAYLAHHPSASTWVDFPDFAFHRLDIVEIRMVAGFGKMGWIDVGDYLTT